MKTRSLTREPAAHNALKLGIAADHGGFELKTFLLKKLQDAGYNVIVLAIPYLNPMIMIPIMYFCS